MGDHERCAPGYQPLYRALNKILGLGIDRRRRLVEDEYARVFEHRAGYRYALLLAAGESDSALAEHGVVCIGHTADEAVRIRDLRRVEHLLNMDIRAAVGNIIIYRVSEHQRLLLDEADRVSVISQVDVPDVYSVDEYLSVVFVIVAHQQVYQRRFAGARCSDYADYVARLYSQIYV